MKRNATQCHSAYLWESFSLFSFSLLYASLDLFLDADDNRTIVGRFVVYVLRWCYVVHGRSASVLCTRIGSDRAVNCMLFVSAEVGDRKFFVAVVAVCIASA